jgi:peptidoglycan/LPS O-acetylase OafA/YrhL
MRRPLIDFLAGAVSVTYLVAAAFFLRFWRRTHDALFRSFAIAFLLFALNQVLASWLGADDERTGYTYVLRVLGFVFILYAIIRKNVGRPTNP